LGHVLERRCWQLQEGDGKGILILIIRHYPDVFLATLHASEEEKEIRRGKRSRRRKW
jgi:hypothetical protein